MSVRLIVFLVLLIPLTSPTHVTATDPTPAKKRELNPQEIEQALALLSQALTKNFDAIHTWQGTCQFRYESNHENSRGTPGSRIWQTTQGRYTFWLDEISDQLRVNYEKTAKPDIFNQLGAPEPVVVDSPTNNQRIVIGSDLYELSEEHFASVKGFPEQLLKQTGAGRVLFRRFRFESEDNHDFFDPRNLFSANSYPSVKSPQIYLAILRGEHGDDLQQQYEHRLSIAELPGPSGQKQYQIKLKSASDKPDGIPRFDLKTYDSSSGWNLISQESHVGSRITQTYSFLYKQIDGIYLPREVIISSYDRRNRHADPVSRQTYQLVDSKLNQPLNRSLFEIKSLQLRPGERMVDQLRSKAFVQTEAGLVPASEFPQHKK